ncbi:hypothetical protein AC578_7528 [Pseudocercospora eumusae]|uniref:Uncharacterized protein n=1 Tax=Pseudocercospora eumusae TaxID=321146 RepID=A0A139GWK1_9PEZI|nr:hypothetical protein AC578_7528 [Pseudocercospora eumusae]
MKAHTFQVLPSAAVSQAVRTGDEVPSKRGLDSRGMSHQRTATKLEDSTIGNTSQDLRLDHPLRTLSPIQHGHHGRDAGWFTICRLSFLSRPAELRVEIHQLALTRDSLCRLSFGGQRLSSSKHMTQVNDFLVCKKWFSEAYPEYLRRNEFEFEFDSIEDLKRFVAGHEISRTTIRAVCFSCF